MSYGIIKKCQSILCSQAGFPAGPGSRPVWVMMVLFSDGCHTQARTDLSPTGNDSDVPATH
eukprot:1619663-Rhodomonas_salina.1